MIVIMEMMATVEQIGAVREYLEDKGFGIHLSQGEERTIMGIIGNDAQKANLNLENFDGVDRVVPILTPYKLAGRQLQRENTVIEIGGLKIGGEEVHVMAGPCAVESREQILEVAEMVKLGGASIMRGGAYKPRTSPYSFQGLEEEGLKYLAEAREKTGLLTISEVVDPRSVRMMAEYVDILQVGTRNMQNFALLRELAEIDTPVLLKRGLSATIEEWIMAAEYILAGGNENVILCERGIRTFETYTRNTLDISAVPIMKQLTHLPIVVDPSHGTGKWKLVAPMAKASLAAGADGLIIEVHPDPKNALSDGPQSLTPENFELLMNELGMIANAVGRKL